MKVTTNNLTSQQWESLKVGDIFKNSHGYIYLKVDVHENPPEYCNSTGVGHGRECDFNYTDRVTPAKEINIIF